MINDVRHLASKISQQELLESSCTCDTYLYSKWIGGRSGLQTRLGRLRNSCLSVEWHLTQRVAGR